MPMPITAAVNPIWLTLEYASTTFGCGCVMPIATRIQRREHACDRQRIAPVGQPGVDRQEADQADDAGLDDDTAQHRGRGHRRRGVRQRHPHVQRDQARLQAEANDQERHDEVAIRCRRQCGRGIADQQAAVRCRPRQQDHRNQHQRLTRESQSQVDPGRTARTRALVLEYQRARTERHRRQHQVQQSACRLRRTRRDSR